MSKFNSIVVLNSSNLKKESKTSQRYGKKVGKYMHGVTVLTSKVVLEYGIILVTK
jgi:hypothetical protein